MLGDVCEYQKGTHSSSKTKINENCNSKFITVAFENKWNNTDIIDGEGKHYFYQMYHQEKYGHYIIIMENMHTVIYYIN